MGLEIYQFIKKILEKIGNSRHTSLYFLETCSPPNVIWGHALRFQIRKQGSSSMLA